MHGKNQKSPRSLKELNVLMDSILESINETGKHVDKVSETVGGIGNNLGDVAEEYFYSSLRRKKSLNGIKYDGVARNLTGFVDDKEWDLVLKNGNSVAVLEVKHKPHPNDILNFATKKLPYFRASLPEYANYKVYGGIAGMAFPSSLKHKAEDLGLMAITQDGGKVKTLNSPGFTPKPY